MITIPQREYFLGDRVWCERAPVEASVVQDHLLRHVVGTESLLGRPVGSGQRRWNREGWDHLDPPVLTEEQRDALTKSIKALAVGGSQCGIPRLTHTAYGGDALDDEVVKFCVACPTTLLQHCIHLCEEVRKSYLAVIDAQLAVLVDAPMLIEETDLIQRVSRLVREGRTDDISAAVVMRFGYASYDNTRQIGRLTSGTGIVVEFWADWSANTGCVGLRRWRTTYRNLHEHPAQRASFLLRGPRVLGNAPALCWVPGSWWDAGKEP